jgi:translation elongation factor EF-Tu-like GTPase
MARRESNPRQLTVDTAGHVDHGKTPGWIESAVAAMTTLNAEAAEAARATHGLNGGGARLGSPRM